MKTIKIELEIFPQIKEVTVYVGKLCNLKEKAKEINAALNGSGGFNVIQGKTYVFAATDGKNADVDDILIHEFTHLIDRITEKLGIKDTETRAYIMQYLWKKSKKHLKEEGE